MNTISDTRLKKHGGKRENAAAVGSSALLGWRDISTAPQDGTEIIVLKRGCYGRPGGKYQAKWGKLADWYVWDWIIEGFGQGTWDTVTHWMPLPESPNSE